MKKNYQFVILFIALISITFVSAQNPNFYLHPNGVTCMCPDAEIGETGVVNGVTYTKRTREQITPQNAATTCTSGITDMANLFEGLQNFNQNISTWDVSSVTNMGNMFASSNFNQPIGNWDVSNVINMQGMFEGGVLAGDPPTIFNQPLGNWDVSNVTNMSWMFSNSTFNQPIENWDVSNVEDMSWMFHRSSFNQPIGNWDMSNVISISWMFAEAHFNQPINSWNLTSLWNLSGIFNNNIFFNQPVNNWDVSQIIYFQYVFMGAESFNQDLSNWIFNQNSFQNAFENFIMYSGMDTNNYESLLQSFYNQNLTNRTMYSWGVYYCDSTYRNYLINDRGWAIGDSGFGITSITAPNNISINANEGTCEATNVNLGTATGQSCYSFTITNNAPASFPLGTTQVTWTIVDSNGNTASSNQTVTVNIQVDDVSVCYVTSDETDFTKNRIFINNLNWNNVEHYQVLRETSANVFDPVGIITQGQTSFLDVSSNNSTQTYRYRVRTLDICNNLSSSSPIHRTILLQSSVATNNSVNLLWNAYEGVSFGTYSIYRKVNEGDFEVIATLPSTNFTYSDTGANVLENNYQYYVAIEIPGCVNGFNNTQIRSNREILDPNMSVGDPLVNNALIIYPNPTSNHLYIEMSESIEFLKAEIFNTVGQKVMDVNESNFSVKNLPVATYFIKIYTTEGTAVKTFLKK